MAIRRIFWATVIHQFSRFFDNTFDSVYVEQDGKFDLACKIGVSDWVRLVGVPTYYGVYFLLRILFVSIIPCVMLLVINCLLFRALRKAEVRLGKLTGFNSPKELATTKKARPSIAQVGARSSSDKECSTTDMKAQLVGNISTQAPTNPNKGTPCCGAGSDMSNKVASSSSRTNNGITLDIQRLRRAVATSSSKKGSQDDAAHKIDTKHGPIKHTDTSKKSRGGEVQQLELFSFGSDKMDYSSTSMGVYNLTESGRRNSRPSGQQSSSHQPVSQCSSGACNLTNQATTEDISCSLATRNSPAAEASNCFDYTDRAMDQAENCSLRNTNPTLKKGAWTTSSVRDRPIKLDKCNSLESRLKCSCQSTPCSLARSFWPLNADRCSCTSSGCVEHESSSQFRLKSGRVVENDWSESYSKSESCVNCYKDELNGFKFEKGVKKKVTKGSSAVEQVEDKQEPKEAGNEVTGWIEDRVQSATTTTTTLHTTSNSASAQAAQTESSLGRPSSTQPRSLSNVSISIIGAGKSGSNNPTVVISRAGVNACEARIRDNNRTTAMLIVMVTLFLMIEVPVAIVTIFHVVSNTYDVFHDEEFTNNMKSIKLFANSCIILSYSLNFFIYCVMSARFRMTLTQVAPFTRMLIGEVKTSDRQASSGRISRLYSTSCLNVNKTIELSSTLSSANVAGHTTRSGLITAAASSPQIAEQDERQPECAL